MPDDKAQPAPLAPTASSAPASLDARPVPEISERDFKDLYNAVEDVARFLSDPAAFRSVLQDKINRKEFRAEWSPLIEMLPDKPVMIGTPAGWQWLYDFNGNPIAMETLASPASQLLEPGAFQPGQVAYIQARIAIVNDANAAVTLFTEERLTLENLGNELRLLPIAPTFDSFSKAAENYRANAGDGPQENTYTSLTSDRDVIESYYRNLEKSLASIKRTLFLAEWLAKQRMPVPDSRTRTEMIGLIARELDFAVLNQAQIGGTLAQFRDEFERYGVHLWFADLDRDEERLDERWAQNTMAQLLPAGAPPSDRVANYFLVRAKKLILHIRNRRPLPRLTLEELTARATTDVASFHGDPDSIPLLDYANALVSTATFPSVESLAFALALCAKLGFGRKLERLVHQVSGFLDPALAADLAEAARNGVHSGETILLVLADADVAQTSSTLPPPPSPYVAGPAPLGPPWNLVPRLRGNPSLASQWKPSPTHAVLPIHYTDAPFLAYLYPPTGMSIPTNLDFSLQLRDVNVPEPFEVAVPVISSRMKLPLASEFKTLDEAVATLRKVMPNAEKASAGPGVTM